MPSGGDEQSHNVVQARLTCQLQGADVSTLLLSHTFSEARPVGLVLFCRFSTQVSMTDLVLRCSVLSVAPTAALFFKLISLAVNCMGCRLVVSITESPYNVLLCVTAGCLAQALHPKRHCMNNSERLWPYSCFLAHHSLTSLWTPSENFNFFFCPQLAQLCRKKHEIWK